MKHRQIVQLLLRRTPTPRGRLSDLQDLAIDAAIETSGSTRAAADYLGIGKDTVYASLRRRGLKVVSQIQTPAIDTSKLM